MTLHHRRAVLIGLAAAGVVPGLARAQGAYPNQGIRSCEEFAQRVQVARGGRSQLDGLHPCSHKFAGDRNRVH